MTERDRNGNMGEPAALRAVPPQLLADLLLVAQLDEESIRRISDELRGSAGMLSQDRIGEIANEHLAGDRAQAVARIIANVEPAEVPSVLSLFDEPSRRNAAEPDAPSSATISKLKGNLSALVQDYPALRLMHKAQRLVRQIGNELQSVVFICDLRPVYDEDHTEVAGFVPLVNMQLGYSKQNGDQDVLEATLTGDELRQFLGRGHDALNKLRILENMLDVPSDAEEAS